VIGEWNRWVLVERLAADATRLAAACRAHLEALPAGSWKERLREALEP
jgi:hypothetical protein